MKKLSAIFLCILFCLTLISCKSEKETFVFDDLKIEVKMQVGENVRATHENTTMLFTNAEKGYYLGVVSVVKEEGKNINEIYDTYIIGDGEKTKTELSDNLIFIDISNKIDSVVLGERVDKMYCFIFYDEATGMMLYGRFFENSERDYVISLAKSIEVDKI